MQTRANQYKILAAAAALGLSGAASADIIAFDLVGSGSQNLISHTNPQAGAYSSAGDGFEIYQRGVSGSIPFAVLDDSLATFPPDTQGIIDDNNTGRFFGVTDTVNSDPLSDTVSASWDFDISGYGDLSLSIDIGAMGDFEDDIPSAGGEDFFTLSYSIDGGPLAVLFDSMVDEAISQTYTLAGGFTTTLDDPLTLDGVSLSNQLQTFTSMLAGTGSVLTLTLTAMTNGGTEAMAFQNMIIEGRAVPEPAMLALFGVGLAGLAFARRRA